MFSMKNKIMIYLILNGSHSPKDQMGNFKVLSACFRYIPLTLMDSNWIFCLYIILNLYEYYALFKYINQLNPLILVQVKPFNNFVFDYYIMLGSLSPWYITNSNLHKNLNIYIVRRSKRYNILHQNKLQDY